MHQPRVRGAAAVTRRVTMATVLCLVTVPVMCLAAGPDTLSSGEHDRAPYPKGREGTPWKTIILDGSALQYAGNLQMNVTNFGFLGSLPNSRYPMSDSPSAQWPAGSTVEYLNAGGIWVGALVDGLESVSTGYPQTEFYPSADPADIVYRSFEGAAGGAHYPGAADDDGDGKVDEDWLNGRDDDGDGRIDEDYAAFGKLMYSCWYKDDEPISSMVWPEHNPLHIGIRQETYQWGDEQFRDFVAVHYGITNIGNRFLTNIYVGIYADLDAGPRDRGKYYMDDMIGTWEGIWCAPVGGVERPVRLSVVYVYDDDGDGGRTPGYFGIVLLGYTTDVYVAQGELPDGTKFTFPYRPLPSVNGMRIFAGLKPFANGGEPVNDLERFSSLTKGGPDQNTEFPNDYKVLMSMGPFGFLPPGGTFDVDIAYVAGAGLDDLLDHAAAAALLYKGIWVNADGRPQTGVSGRETPLVGVLKNFVPDLCAWDYDPNTTLHIKEGDTIWVNADCGDELWYYQNTDCNRPWAPLSAFQTGVNGRETLVRWVTSSSPPPPSMRLVSGDGKVTVYWDNLSEIVPDALSQRYDFEGYEIWRADNWHRPIGTTVTSGPSVDLWHLIERRDIVNGVSPDHDFKMPVSAGGFQYKPLVNLGQKDRLIRAFEEAVHYAPLDTVPCPPGLTNEECDTLEALARWNLGLDGGRQYYAYVDTEVKNGMPLFYSVVACDNTFASGSYLSAGLCDSPYSNFKYVVGHSTSQEPTVFRENDIYVVPNPVTKEQMEPWRLGPTNADPSGEKVEFRNLPKCVSTVRIYTISGDLVQELTHDGTSGNGTLPWNLISRNGQSITSGIYLYSVQPQDGRFHRFVGKFVVVR